MKFNNLPTKSVTGLALSSALLSGCVQNPELTFSPDHVTEAHANGFINSEIEVKIRTSPQRIENIDFDNSCGKTKTNIFLDSVKVAISDGIGTDSNGVWVGIKPEDLPSNIAEDCSSKYGGMLWIAKRYVTASITESVQPITSASER
jgi:hypothetical protein